MHTFDLFIAESINDAALTKLNWKEPKMTKKSEEKI